MRPGHRGTPQGSRQELPTYRFRRLRCAAKCHFIETEELGASQQFANLFRQTLRADSSVPSSLGQGTRPSWTALVSISRSRASWSAASMRRGSSQIHQPRRTPAAMRS